MITTLALVAGVIISLALVFLARMKWPKGEMRIYAVGLVGTALIYVLFGVVGGASARWLAVEGLGVFIYGALAWAGLRWRSWLLALGWAGHVAWDLLLHLNGAGAAHTPFWYPWFCTSFDLIVAVAVLAASRRDTTSPNSIA